MRLARASLVALALAVLATAAAAAPDPHPLPQNLPAAPAGTLKVTDHARFAALEVAFTENGKGVHDNVLGEKWNVAVTGGAKQFDYAAWKAAAEQAGWRVLTPSGYVLARRTDAGGNSWFKMSRSESFELLVEHPVPVVALTAPATAVESLDKDKDVPFFAPLATMKRKTWKLYDTGAGVEVTHGHGPEFVGPPYVQIDYTDDDGSGVEVQQIYKAALEKAGWTILMSNFGGYTIAHYTKDGRDVWAKFVGTRGMTLIVCDVGAAAAEAKLEAELDRHGHVAVYGIYFDTDKDTINGESEATLQQILLLLNKLPKLKLEIQGHTDDVGSHDHNQTLSDARAAAVKKWLVDHKIDGARLTPKGYAETKPVDDNKTAGGRAHNRRVELAKVKP